MRAVAGLPAALQPRILLRSRSFLLGFLQHPVMHIKLRASGHAPNSRTTLVLFSLRMPTARRLLVRVAKDPKILCGGWATRATASSCAMSPLKFDSHGERIACGIDG